MTVSEKLREIEHTLFCIKSNMTDKKDYGTLNSLGHIQSVIDEIRLNQSQHETVEEWEKRTGETYPDDGPVYYTFPIDDFWSLCEYKEWKQSSYSTVNGAVVVVANHHGKPEEKV
jgi:hypothetical protein